MEWRLIKDSYHTGFMNMAIDEAIMIAHREGLAPPTISGVFSGPKKRD
jgi:lipoate-protein ligase A